MLWQPPAQLETRFGKHITVSIKRIYNKDVMHTKKGTK